ncbi:MAG: guanylate kinase [Ignavibacteria bacterium]|nr:guanylate kinase [Ignavibacteria bacterium]
MRLRESESRCKILSSDKVRGKIYVISAPSGTGKTTIIKRIKEIRPEIRFSISAATRNPRGIEVHGKDYYFLSKDDFMKKVKAGEFVEWEEVFGNYYGTLKSELVDTVEKGEDVILEIDVKGALNIKQQFPESVLVFLLPPSIEELVARLTGRNTEKQEELEKRIARAELEFSFREQFDHCVVNNDLEECVNEVLELISKPKTIGGNQ